MQGYTYEATHKKQTLKNEIKYINGFAKEQHFLAQGVYSDSAFSLLLWRRPNNLGATINKTAPPATAKNTQEMNR